MNVLLLDMAVLSYRLDRRRGVVTVAAPGVAELACASVPVGVSEREAVYLGLNAVLDEARVPFGAGWVKVALYNSVTFQVAFGAVPGTLAYGDDDPVMVPPGGLLGTAGPDGLLLESGRCLPTVTVSAESVSRAVAAHRA